MENENNIFDTNGESEKGVENIKLPERAKKAFQGFSLKERLLPSILLAFALPFTLVFFGIFELYSGNLTLFPFALGDFFGIAVAVSLISAILIGTALVFIKGRAFDIVFALFSWLTLMFVIQTYLNQGLSLTGDGVGEAAALSTVIINTAIWLLVGAAIFTAFFFVKNRDLLRLIMTVLMISVIGMQSFNFATISFTNSDVFKAVSNRGESEELLSEDRESEFLTTKYLTELSSDGNIIVFVVDRFDSTFCETALNKNPELFESLDGFTYYKDHISLYARTFPSVAYLLTQAENDFTLSKSEFFEKAYGEAETLRELKKNNYRINIYTDTGYAYEDAYYMREYVSNSTGSKGYTVPNKFALFAGMFKLSLYRAFPYVLKGTVDDISTDSLAKDYVVYDIENPKYTTDMKDVFDEVSEDDFTLISGEKSFSFIHIQGCHTPNKYDDEWNDATDANKWSTTSALKQSFAIINEYISEMKKLGVYEDSTIIIVGDHASAVSDTKPLSGARRTALFVKPKGAFGEALKTSEKQVAQENIWATIFESEGIKTELSFGESIFSISEGDRTRRYLFHRIASSNEFEIIEYEVTGDSSDFSNWEIVSKTTVDHGIYK